MDKKSSNDILEPCIVDDTIHIDVSSSELDSFVWQSDDLIMNSSMANSNFIYSTAGAMGATGSSSSWGNVTISTSGSGYNGTWGTNGSVLSSSKSGLHVTSNAQFDGDVKIKGVSILETLEKIEKRLSILRPDPEKLEHFESLRKAYEHYKTLEALCELPSKEEDK